MVSTRNPERTGAMMWAAVGKPAVQQAMLTLKSMPFTLGVLAVFLGAAALTGSFLDGPPEQLLGTASVSGPGLRDGLWWSLFTSLFFATNPLAYLAASLMIVLLLGLAERRLGRRAAVGLFFGGQFAAVTVFLLVTQLAGYVGDGWLDTMADDSLIGPYAPVLTAGLAASARIPLLWQRRLRTTVLSVSILLVLYVGHAETVIGLIGALLGLLAGWWIQGDQGRLHRHRSTGRETRNLLALTVAVFAVGPILTGITRAPTGPLALLRDVVLSPMPTLNQLVFNCGATVDASCLETGRAGFAGPFGLALAVVPVILLLICADGMRRGRRLALNIALAIQLAVTALAAVYLTLFALVPSRLQGTHATPMSSAFAHVLPLVIVPLLLAVVLWLNRRQFRVQTRPGARRKLATVVCGTWLVLSSSYTVAWFWSGGLSRDGGVLGLFAELARQYVPVPIPQHLRRVFPESDSAEALLFAYSGPVFWLVALGAVLWVLLGRRHGLHFGRQDRDRARGLLHQGGGPLSWMALWEPNTYWFSPDGAGGMAFQQHGTVALTLGGAFGDRGAEQRVTEGFLDYCRSHALIPALYSCDDAIWPMLKDRGFSRVAVAQETRLALNELEFKGKEWQNVRTALNRAAKLGVHAVWGPYHSLPAALRSRLNEVSEEWAAGKSVPEMGFTLGGVDELDDGEVLCCLAVDGHGTVHGVTSWLPVYDGGRLVSRTLDVMRRGSEGFPGVMEFLIASAVLELRDSVDVISLSGSPLAARPDQAPRPDQAARDGGGSSGTSGTSSADTGDAGPGDGMESGVGDNAEAADEGAQNLVRILDLVGHALEPVYGFRSLAAFKSRFKPEYRALYLYYQDPLHLPAIGRALTRAYLPGLSLAQGARLVRKLVS
ncbi:bifunctional lysylphosphatidylglycerol flippase/synthetase MprF [Paenarthrobacter sp. 22069]|uniref:bifunctional lysylphosphatidylglycerol flippase/synthetase MprF n=1 Tax=Paenarthrobacter sp. 22069 TaxID=3453864 RepID=UPI003F82AA46